MLLNGACDIFMYAQWIFVEQMMLAYSGMMAEPIRLMVISRRRVTSINFPDMSFPLQPWNCLNINENSWRYARGAYSLLSQTTKYAIFFPAHSVLVFMVEWDLWSLYLKDNVYMGGTKMQWGKREKLIAAYILWRSKQKLSQGKIYLSFMKMLLVMKGRFQASRSGRCWIKKGAQFFCMIK